MARKRQNDHVDEVELFEVEASPRRLSKAERRGVVAAIRRAIYADAPALTTAEYQGAFSALDKLMIRKRRLRPKYVYTPDTRSCDSSSAPCGSGASRIPESITGTTGEPSPRTVGRSGCGN